jgi:hypothetical protein
MMKNIRPLVILVVLGINLSAYSKQDDSKTGSMVIRTEAMDDFGLSVKNDMLAFSTLANYKTVIENPEEAVRNNFMATVIALRHPASLLNNKTTDLYKAIDDDYFAALLNVKGCVQIGAFIYKVNPFNSSVFVLAEANIASLSDLLIENISNKDILLYSINEEVIEMVESGTPSGKRTGLFCESAVATTSLKKDVKVENPNGESGWLSGEVKYSYIGIGFKLKATGWLTCLNRYIQIHIVPNYYKQKCGYMAGPMQQWNYGLTTGPTNSSGIEYQSYMGIKPLNEIYFRVIFMAKYGPNFYYPDPSVDLEIRKNY